MFMLSMDVETLGKILLPIFLLFLAIIMSSSLKSYRKMPIKVIDRKGYVAHRRTPQWRDKASVKYILQNKMFEEKGGEKKWLNGLN